MTKTTILRTLKCWDDLRPYGIDLLTGEACAYSMRLLCDVNEEGKKLLEEFFGGCITIADGSNWNSGTKYGGSVGSVMLTRSIFAELAAFILLTTTEVDSTIATFEGGAIEYTGKWLSGYGELGRTYRTGPGPTEGGRNVNMASGRVSEAV